jgi:50S ribosomal subunit-associated GTPase HflX
LDEAHDIVFASKSPPEMTIVVSAQKNWNLDKLLVKIEEVLGGEKD